MSLERVTTFCPAPAELLTLKCISEDPSSPKYIEDASSPRKSFNCVVPFAVSASFPPVIYAVLASCFTARDCVPLTALESAVTDAIELSTMLDFFFLKDP